jgi:hypothetical protein
MRTVVVAVVAEVVEIDDANDEEHAEIKPVKRRTKMSDSDATLRMITPRLNVIAKAKLPRDTKSIRRSDISISPHNYGQR